MRSFFILILLTCFFTSAYSQKVGINQTNPNASLDINGDVIFERDNLSLQNGQNDNVDITSNKFSFYEVTGVTNAFQVSGFNGGVDGKILIVHNPSVHTMTLQNQHGGSIIANQIFTGASGDIAFTKGESVILGYTSSNNRWVVLSRYAQGGCPPGMISCSGGCVSLNLDPQHCGGCGTVCPFGTQCYNGICTLFACPVGYGNCNGLLADGCEINLLTSNTNCGTCGNLCNFPNATSTCVNGICVITSCNPGFYDCNGFTPDGCESDINFDQNNCGACGNVCSFPNATGYCINGVCGMTCNPGYSDCNGIMADGCEVNTQNNLTNCGFCGNVCQALPNATSICVGGTCMIGSCSAGFGDCNNSPIDGCESNILSDVFHCGSCNNLCLFQNASATCVNGMCVMGNCNLGFGDCNNSPIDGCETFLSNNINNCGACGNVCALPNAISQCTGGTCQILSCNMGYSDCDGLPANGCECNLTCVNGTCQ
jgi:Stigma-specific protein, Stig1